jgi:hypothetical protein
MNEAASIKVLHLHRFMLFEGTEQWHCSQD